MKAPSKELLAVAQRVVWFKDPRETLSDDEFFLVYLMTYGTIEDILIAKKYYTYSLFLKTLAHAPAGIFDPRSWAYWHTIFDRLPVPLMPTRKIG